MEKASFVLCKPSPFLCKNKKLFVMHTYINIYAYWIYAYTIGGFKVLANCWRYHYLSPMRKIYVFPVATSPMYLFRFLYEFSFSFLSVFFSYVLCNMYTSISIIDMHVSNFCMWNKNEKKGKTKHIHICKFYYLIHGTYSSIQMSTNTQSRTKNVFRISSLNAPCICNVL